MRSKSLSVPATAMPANNTPPPAGVVWLDREYIWGPGNNGVDELLAQFDSSRNPTYALTDASGDVVALCDTGAAGNAARVVAQFTYDAHGSVASAEYLHPHAYLKCGHKGLFAFRLDAGVYDADIGGSLSTHSVSCHG